MPEMLPVKSSNVAAIGYDHDGSRLHVDFKNGGSYIYHGITPDQHAALMKAKSVGSHMHSEIKPKAASVNRIDK
jgi:hypothetical protein